MKTLILLVLVFLITSCAGSRPHSESARSKGKGKDASYYYLLSEMEGRRNNPTKAIEYLDRALERDPAQSRLWYKRAFFYAASGNLKKGEEDIAKALELSPNDEDALVLQGKIQQGLDKKTEAIVSYRRGIRLNPSLEEANILLIEVAVSEKDYRTALQTVAAWEKNDPDNVTPIFYEAWIYQNFFGNIPRAVAACEKILSLEPDNMKAMQTLAEIYVGQKNNAKVLEIFRRMEVAQPNDVALKLKMALIYYEQKRYEEAIGKFEELLKTRPEDDRIIYYLGVIDENLKRDSEAEREFLNIKADSNFFKDARLHLAYLKVRAEKKEEAIQILEDSIELKPEVGALYEYLSEIYRDRGDLPTAVKVLKTGIKRGNDKESLYYSLGLVNDRAGQFEDSMRAMRQVLKLNPKNANAMNYIGYSYADRGLNLDEALDLLQKAMVLKPDDGYITDSLGWVYFRRGDLEQAFTYAQKAYSMTQGEATITEHLGDISLKRNDKAKALKLFREATSLLEKRKGQKNGDGQLTKDLERLKKKIGEVES